jgi:hypothetical protein
MFRINVYFLLTSVNSVIKNLMAFKNKLHLNIKHERT